MTLGGMAIAIGALVDDAIIDVENIIRRLPRECRLADREAAVRRRGDLPGQCRGPGGRSSCHAHHSCWFFVPLLFLSGVEGRLLRPLGIAFAVSLAVSLLAALTLTPALSLPVARQQGGTQGSRTPGRPTTEEVVCAPAWLLWRVHPWWVVAPTVVLLVLAILGAANMGSSFLPSSAKGPWWSAS